MTFDERREDAMLGEQLVERWLQSRGNGTVASYLYSGRDGAKAPRLMFRATGYVIPDLDVCREGMRWWCEVKTHHHAHPNDKLTRERNKRLVAAKLPVPREPVLVHGIKARHRLHYLDVQRVTGAPIFVFVVEVGTGALLIARLDRLEWHRCQCRCGGRDPDHLVYARRDDMRHEHTFSDRAMAEIRHRWPTPASASSPFTDEEQR